MIKAKRFWEKAEARADENAEHTYRVFLDERELKTPYKNSLTLPSLKLAEAVAEEWRAVEGEIVPDEMPMTKMANSAVERIPHQRLEVENHLLEYLESDLLIYRAVEPVALIERQKRWDEWIEWAKNHKIYLTPIAGIIGDPQPGKNVKTARDWLADLSDFEMVSFYEYVTLTGSFVLAMAIFENALEAPQALEISRIDEDYQAEIWGRTDDVEEHAQRKIDAMTQAERFRALL